MKRLKLWFKEYNHGPGYGGIDADNNRCDSCEFYGEKWLSYLTWLI